jgi:hypothetical protein
MSGRRVVAGLRPPAGPGAVKCLDLRLFADAEHKHMRRQINKIKGLSSSDYFSVNATLLQARANAKST